MHFRPQRLRLTGLRWLVGAPQHRGDIDVFPDRSRSVLFQYSVMKEN